MTGVLKGKNILLAVTGGIAAYKCPELCRLLTKRGASVQVILSDCARHFVSPLVMSSLTSRPIPSNHPQDWQSMEHIELARWCDLIVIAPATANIIAKIAHGICDDLITNAVLATKNKNIAMCPAMNVAMFENIATQQNTRTLSDRGVLIWGPATGEQACGEYGQGRMIEPVEIVERACGILADGLHVFTKTDLLLNKTILITSGPTREYLDPVRYISNRSSGKMGYAVALAACDLGSSRVILVSGPSDSAESLKRPPQLEIHNVTSGLEMHARVMRHIDQCDLFVGCAAVSDYRPCHYSQQKIKKEPNMTSVSVEFEENPDIIADVAKLARKPLTNGQRRCVVVGFAAETVNVEENARAKLERKMLDAICANDCSLQSRGGFESDWNELIILKRDGTKSVISGSKNQLGYRVFEAIHDLIR